MSTEQEKYKTIISRILDGETQLFLIIVDDHKRLVSRFVWKMIDKPTEREDICQDIFLKVFKNLAKFKYKSKLSTWIGQIAYNTCMNYIDKKKVGLYDDFFEDTSSSDIFNSDDFNAAQLTVNKDTAERLQKELNEIPVQLRTALALYHLEEMKYEEISEIMKLPLGTVKSHIFRARKLLKEKLEIKYNREELWHDH